MDLGAEASVRERLEDALTLQDLCSLPPHYVSSAGGTGNAQRLGRRRQLSDAEPLGQRFRDLR